MQRIDNKVGNLKANPDDGDSKNATKETVK